MSARQLAVVIGSMVSMSAVIGCLSYIMTRYCQIQIAASTDWDTVQVLDSYCLSEIQFWNDNLSQVNKRDCFVHVENYKMVYSDASSYACGALIKGTTELT